MWACRRSLLAVDDLSETLGGRRFPTIRAPGSDALLRNSTLQIARVSSAHGAADGEVVDPESFNRISGHTARGDPRQLALGRAPRRRRPSRGRLAGGGEASWGVPPAAAAVGEVEMGEVEEARKRSSSCRKQQLLAQFAANSPVAQREQGNPDERAQRSGAPAHELLPRSKSASTSNARPKRGYISPATREEVYAY
jgi:protein TonB